MSSHLSKIMAALTIGSTLVSCGKSRNKEPARPPEVQFQDKILGMKYIGNENQGEILIGYCKRTLDNGFQQEFGIYRDRENKGTVDIYIQEVLYDINDNGYSIKKLIWRDVARHLKIEDVDGGLEIRTTPQSLGLASPSKLDLKPEGTIVLALPQGPTKIDAKLNLKGYIEGDFVECKRIDETK